MKTAVEESKAKQKHDVTKPCTQCVLLHWLDNLSHQDRECVTQTQRRLEVNRGDGRNTAQFSTEAQLSPRAQVAAQRNRLLSAVQLASALTLESPGPSSSLITFSLKRNRASSEAHHQLRHHVVNVQEGLEPHNPDATPRRKNHNVAHQYQRLERHLRDALPRLNVRARSVTVTSA